MVEHVLRNGVEKVGLKKIRKERMWESDWKTS